MTKPPRFKDASWRKIGKVKKGIKKEAKSPLLKGGWALAHVPPYYFSYLVSRKLDTGTGPHIVGSS